MYFFCQRLVFVNFNNFKSCLVLSEVYSKLFILCSHSSCWFVGIFSLLCKLLLLKFLPRKKIQQKTPKVLSWRPHPTSLWRASACGLSSLEKVAGGWREEEKKKSPEHGSLGRLAALLPQPLRSALVPGIGQERLSGEMPVLSEQMSCCRLLDRAQLLALAVLAAWQG